MQMNVLVTESGGSLVVFEANCIRLQNEFYCSLIYVFVRNLDWPCQKEVGH